HNPKDRYIESSGTPPGCDPIKDPIPGGLRGLRPPATFLQPFGLRSGESTIWRIANGRPRFLVNPCAAGWITGLGQFEKRRVKFAIFLSVLSSLHVVLSSLTLFCRPCTLCCHPRTLFCRPCALFCHPRTLFCHPCTLCCHPCTLRCHPCTLRGRRCTLRLCRLMCGKALPFPGSMHFRK